MCQAVCVSYKNQCKEARVLREQRQRGKCYTRHATVKMGKTQTGDPLSHTEHQRMSAIPSHKMQNTTKKNPKYFFESAQNND